MALARSRGRPARVPLARSARATRSSGMAARTAFPGVVAPGETVELESTLVAPRPPGSYRLAFDLVEEFRFWFQELGSAPLDLARRGEAADRRATARRPRARPVGSGARTPRSQRRRSRSSPRTRSPSLISSRARPRAGLVAPAARRARRGLRGGRAGDRSGVAQRPPPSRRRGRREVGGTRASASRSLLPSLLEGLEPVEHEGLPAYAGRDGLFEGRAVVRLRSRSGRRTG